MHHLKKIGMPKLKPSRSRSRSPTSQSGKSMVKQNVNEEYYEVFRTKSYAEITSKVEGQLKRRVSLERISSSSSSSSPPSYSFPHYVDLSDRLLEPSQQTALDMVRSSPIHALLMDYFNLSLDACNLCELLLQSIHRTRSNYRYVRRAIKNANGNDDNIKEEKIAKDFSSFANLRNPLSVTSTQEFSNIHERLSLLLHRLISKHKEITRKMKFARFCRKVLGFGFVVSYSVVATALLILAVHSIVGVMGVPGIVMACSCGVEGKISKVGNECSRAARLKLVCGQLDIAARGVYILINELDTMDRLVARLDDEVQHTKVVAGMCVKNFRRDQEVPREAVKELEMHKDGFLEQLDELQKHVYFCFLSINRSRRMVMQELMASMEC